MGSYANFLIDMSDSTSKWLQIDVDFYETVNQMFNISLYNISGGN